jgi:hypothetical protein
MHIHMDGNMNNILMASEKWLNEMGVETKSHSNCLWVSRTGMVAVIGEDEEKCYDEILKALREAVSTKLLWDGKDDNWLYLGSF